MRRGSKKYRRVIASLDEVGITTNVVRISPKQFELHKNYEIIAVARKRETCNRHLIKLSNIHIPKPINSMFFQQLAEISPAMDLTLRLMMKGGKITVAVMPATDEDLKPLTVSGTALELDEGFIDTIRKPMELVSGLTSNAEEFIESVKKTEKPTGKKETKPPKTETPKELPKEEGQTPDETPVSTELKFHNGDRVIFFNPGPHRGKVGNVIDEQPNEAGEITVRFDKESEDLPIAVKDFQMYKRLAAAKAPETAAAQPELIPEQPAKPAPPKPGPPKPAPTTA